MENFIVSARKYRPATFDTVVGQHAITGTLKNAIRNNQLAQAFLFCGPRGVGKTTCARILAKTINCENISDNVEACDECESCTSFNNAASFNIHELDAASNNSVDDIRSLVDQVRIPPQVGKYKVYIIDEVHMLSQQAFNAFLKTLEEPPPYAKFILATTEKHKIIPTILSRCQIFDFKRIGVEDIAKHLSFVAEKEGVTADSDALHIIAQKADGALRDALSMFDQIVSFAGKELTYQIVIENLNVLDYDYYFRIVDYILNQDITKCLLTLNEIIENGFDGQHFLIGLGEHLRNLLVCKDPSSRKLLEVGDNIRNSYFEQSARCDTGLILKALVIGNQCDINYRSSNNKRLSLELALMQMSSLSRSADSPSAGKVVPVVEKPSVKEISIKTPVKKPTSSVVPNEEATGALKKKVGVTKTTMSGSGLSIKDMVNNTNKNGQAGEQQENTLVVKKQSTPFSQVDLEGVWPDMVAVVANNNSNFQTTLSKHKPTLKEKYLVELVLENHVQEDEINLKKSDLINFLRKKLKNDLIHISTVIQKDISESKPYTPMEKFNKMAEKNPALRMLKNQLDLEIDF